MVEQYHTLLKEILGKGDVQYEPRTEEYILGISGSQSIYDLREGFPLVTTKNVPPRLPFEELFWKLRGEKNVKSLVDRNVNIWTANSFDRFLKNKGLKEKFPKHSPQWNEEFKNYSERIKKDANFTEYAGDLGPVYGYQWRHWEHGNSLLEFSNILQDKLNINIYERIPELMGKEEVFVKEEIDQLEKMLKGIRERPGSRYHTLSAWNVGDLSKMALGPCPFWHQFSVFGENIDLHMVQRSNDVFLGVPFNIAQDAALLHLVAKETGYLPRYFIHTPINLHAYLGVKPRADFWMNPKNVEDFQKRFNKIKSPEGYLALKERYLFFAPEESEGNKRKDHIPFILEQLSKSPQGLSEFEIVKEIPLLKAINEFPLDIVNIKNYNPLKWDSEAVMAA